MKHTRFISTTIVALLLSLLTWTTIQAQDSLVYEFSFDGTLKDSIQGSSFIGENYTFQNNRCEMPAHCMQAKNETFTFSDSVFIPDSVNEFTVSFNVRYVKTATNYMHILGQWGNEWDEQAFDILIQGRKIRFQVSKGTGFERGVVSTKEMYDDVWYHVVCVYDKIGQQTVYINNKREAIGTQNEIGINRNPKSKMEIGSKSRNQYGSFNGQLDNFRFFNRAFKSYEVEKLYYKDKKEGCQPKNYLTGKLYDSMTGFGTWAEITVYDKETGKHVPFSFDYKQFTFITHPNKQYIVKFHDKEYHDYCDTIGPFPSTWNSSFYLNRKDSLLTLKNISFKRGKAKLSPLSFKELDKIVRMLKSNTKMEIEVRGHTDNMGDAKINLKLSQDRAENVKQYLVDQGIAENRIGAKGFGGSQPIASNKQEHTRRKNRRVELFITKH